MWSPHRILQTPPDLHAPFGGRGPGANTLRGPEPLCHWERRGEPSWPAPPAPGPGSCPGPGLALGGLPRSGSARGTLRHAHGLEGAGGTLRHGPGLAVAGGTLSVLLRLLRTVLSCLIWSWFSIRASHSLHSLRVHRQGVQERHGGSYRRARACALATGRCPEPCLEAHLHAGMGPAPGAWLAAVTLVLRSMKGPQERGT